VGEERKELKIRDNVSDLELSTSSEEDFVLPNSDEEDSLECIDVNAKEAEMTKGEEDNEEEKEEIEEIEVIEVKEEEVFEEVDELKKKLEDIPPTSRHRKKRSKP